MACTINITAPSGTDSITEHLEAFKSKACLSALCKRGKRKKGEVRALPKLCVCICMDSAKESGSRSQASIGKNWH